MPYSDYPWQRNTLDRAPASQVYPDVEPPPAVASSPDGLTDQPGFWPGMIIGASFMVVVILLGLAVSTAFGRVI